MGGCGGLGKRARWMPVLVVVLLAIAASGCTSRIVSGEAAQKIGDDAAGSTTVAITGSSTIAPLMVEIGKRFEQRHPGVRVDVQMGGSSRGLADARRGLADIGMVSRDLSDDEDDLQAFPIARDGVCIILNAANPVDELSRAEVVDIYTGEIDNWKDVGGWDAPITVVNKAAGRSTLQVFTTGFGLDSRKIDADVIIGDNEQGIKTVAGNPGAIGYVSVGAAQLNRDMQVPIKLLPVSGVEASVDAVAMRSFPVSRTLNLVTSSAPEGLTAQLIEFARSSEVHDLIKDLSFVPIQH